MERPAQELRLRRAVWFAWLSLVASGAACCRGVAGPPRTDHAGAGEPPLPRLEWRGTVGLAGSATPRRGDRHAVCETSGIVWLGDDRYAAVMDGSDRLVVFSLALGGDGGPLSATALDSVSLGADRDWEDLAVVGSGPARRLFAVAEAAPALWEFAVDADLGACRAVGSWTLGDVFPRIRPNRGPEALGADPDGAALWTANEEALEGDGGPVADGEEGTVRIVRLPLDPVRGGDERLVEGRREWIYPVDPPHARVGLPGDRPYSGVVAIAALSAGRLLLLERSAGRGVPPIENRIFLVDVGAIEGSDGGRPAEAVPRVAKELLWRGSLGMNLEGLCLGPALGDGGRAVVAIADNGAEGRLGAEDVPAPNPLVVFALVDESPGEQVTSP